MVFRLIWSELGYTFCLIRTVVFVCVCVCVVVYICMKQCLRPLVFFTLPSALAPLVCTRL